MGSHSSVLSRMVASEVRSIARKYWLHKRELMFFVAKTFFNRLKSLLHRSASSNEIKTPAEIINDRDLYSTTPDVFQLLNSLHRLARDDLYGNALIELTKSSVLHQQKQQQQQEQCSLPCRKLPIMAFRLSIARRGMTS